METYKKQEVSKWLKANPGRAAHISRLLYFSLLHMRNQQPLKMFKVVSKNLEFGKLTQI
jgi:hypothetical protein